MMSQAAGNRSGPTQSLLKSFISLLYTIGIRTNCLNSIRGVRLLQPMKEKMVPWISHFEGGQNQDTLRKLPKCFTPVKMVGTWRTLGEPIGDDVGPVRLRWPIFPIHDRSTLAYREATALGGTIRNRIHGENAKLLTRIESLEGIVSDLVGLLSSSNFGAAGADISDVISQISIGGYTLIESDAECGSSDHSLGTLPLQDCANEVRAQGGEYFIYGKGRKNGKCYIEFTTSADCPEGFESDLYDFYKLAQEEAESSSGEDGEELQVGQWTELTYPVISLHSGQGIPESHTHDIFCDWNCFVLLMHGDQVTITSEDWDGHTHDFTFKLADDKTSIIFLECDSCGTITDSFVLLPSTGKCTRGRELTEEQCEGLGDGGAFANWRRAGSWRLPETCGCYIDQNGSRYFNRFRGACDHPEAGELMICKEYISTDPHNSIIINNAYQEAFLDSI